MNAISELCPRSGSSSFTPWQPLVLASYLPVLQGTGGVQVIDRGAATRTGLTIVRELPAAEETARAATMASSDRVLLIRRWFSLSIAEAARVLMVQRPTIYAWERGDVPEKKNAQRIREVFDFADHWRSLSAEPLGVLRKELITSHDDSLVDLLSERVLRPEVVRSALSTLLARKQKHVAGRQHSAAELARRLGFRPLATETAERSIAREARGVSGRPDDEE